MLNQISFKRNWRKRCKRLFIWCKILWLTIEMMETQQCRRNRADVKINPSACRPDVPSTQRKLWSRKTPHFSHRKVLEFNCRLSFSFQYIKFRDKHLQLLFSWVKWSLVVQQKIMIGNKNLWPNTSVFALNTACLPLPSWQQMNHRSRQTLLHFCLHFYWCKLKFIKT